MKKILTTLIITTFSIIVIAPPLYAHDDNFLDLKNLSGALYSDELDKCEDLDAEGSYDGIPTTGLSSVQSAFVDKYHNIAAKLGQQYHIPWEAVMAQGILESGGGLSNFARERNNFFGIGAFDSNPNNAFSYKSPEEGWKGYFENIKNTPTYRNHGVFQGETVTNPYKYLAAIKAAGYATAPNYLTAINPIVKAIEKRAKEKNWDSSAKLNSSGAAPINSNSTNLQNGNSSINQAALQLAWPDYGKHDRYDAKPEYKKAMAATGTSKNLNPCAQKGAACNTFVATVLRFSGVDKKYESGPVPNQYNYMLQHPEIYKKLSENSTINNAKPGDIRISPNAHIELVVKRKDGSLGIASASLCDRTAEIAAFYPRGNDYKIFRSLKGGDLDSTESDCIETDGSSANLKEGGFKDEQSARRAVIQPYRNESNVSKYGVVAAGCPGGIKANCSAFSTYFVNKYVTGMKGRAIQRNGNQMASSLINNNGFKDGGRIPTPYAVFSQTAAACGFGSSNHTGVVLSINKSQDLLLIGEAGCSNRDGGSIRKLSLKCMTNNSAFHYAYPPGVKTDNLNVGNF